MIRQAIQRAVLRAVSFLFPARLPGRIKDWDRPVDEDFIDLSRASKARPKFQNGIERYFWEVDQENNS
jgi:hypothetical protein